MSENNGTPRRTYDFSGSAPTTEKPAKPNKKLTTCKACGATIAKSAKKCPSCGAKNKKPLYKRVWVWVLVVLIMLLRIGDLAGGGDTAEANSGRVPAQTNPPAQTQTKPEPVIEYTAVAVSELEEALKANAFNAKETYNGKYLELTGVVTAIDSNGKYFGLKSRSDWSVMSQVICYLGDNMESELASLAVDQTVTIRGKIFEVGEVLGYYFDIIEFVK